MHEEDLTDLQKAKIDLLKTSFSDVVSTIRAFEYKIRFLLTICLAGLSIFGALYLQFLAADMANGRLETAGSEMIRHLLIIALISAGWFLAVKYLFLASEPKNNPQDVLAGEEISPYGEVFYIPVDIGPGGKVAEKVMLQKQLEALEKVESFDALAKVYYGEIAIISYIRDLKSHYLQKAYGYVWFSMIVTVINIWLVFAWPSFKMVYIGMDILLLLGFSFYLNREKRE